MEENNILKTILLKLPASARLFRNNVALGWVGSMTKKVFDKVILSNARPLHAGLCKGSSDLIGWTSVEITPEMVGKKIAVFTAIEVKTNTGRPSKDQLNFIEVVKSSGGFAGVARSEKDIKEIISI
jgi:hypothetical protein